MHFHKLLCHRQAQTRAFGLVVSIAGRDLSKRREDLIVQLKVAADRIRHQIPAAEPVGYLISLPVDENQALGFADRKRVEDHLIDQRIDRRGCANTKRERQYSGRSERATARTSVRC